MRIPLRTAVGRRSLLASLGAGAVLALSTAPAEAAFSLDACEGTDTSAQGASFANSAQAGWKQGFDGETGCGGTPTVAPYRANGSGNGNASMGAGMGSTTLGCAVAGTPPCTTPLAPGTRDLTTRFAGTDDAPSVEAVNNMNNGLAGSADDGDVRVIPIALGATAVYMRLPDACSLDDVPATSLTGQPNDGTGDLAINKTRRPLIPNTFIEQAFRGISDMDTWGELIPGITPAAGCADAPIVRVVRRDRSGTTVGFKAYLNLVNPGFGWTSGSLRSDNRNWPTTADSAVSAPADAATAGMPCSPTPARLCSATADNAQNQAANVAISPGTIAYGDLASIRTAGFEITPGATQDRTFWIPLQNLQGAQTYQEPTQDRTAHIVGTGVRGANCTNTAIVNQPPGTGGDVTFGDWFETFAAGGTGYPACVLTYSLAWDDNAPVYGNTLIEQQRARTVKDYLAYVVGEAGQLILPARDYAPLTPGLRDIARAAVNDIGWNKAADTGGGGTPPGGGGGGGDTGGGGTPPGGGGNPAPPQAPAPLPRPPSTPLPPVTSTPSNAFSVTSRSGNRTRVLVNLRVPGAGNVRARATVRQGRRNVAVGSATARPTRSGTVRVTVRLSATARRALNRSRTRRLAIRVAVTYTPTGGRARTITRSVTIRR